MEDGVQTFDRRGVAEARVGQLLRGKWRLDALLGAGGMANVYAATHRNGRRGAVKVLHPDMATNADVRARFLREGYVANKVSHPGAVAVLDDDQTEDGTVFLVMELLDGQTVQGSADARPTGVLDVRVVVMIADCVLDVLASAHDKGIVHRDLKPENLFLTRSGQVKVLDFGIARLLEGRHGSIATQAGSLYGTPSFMPPEQARGLWDEVDGRSDLWALGATLFTLLTGREVHNERRSINELMLAAMSHAAPPIRTLVEVPDAIADVIDRALAFDKNERWPSARTMQTALRQAYQQSFSDALPAGLAPTLAAVVVTQPPREPTAASTARARPSTRAPERASRLSMRAGGARWWWPALSVAAVALALLAAVWTSRRRSEDEQRRPARAEGLLLPASAAHGVPALPTLLPAAAATALRTREHDAAIPESDVIAPTAAPLRALPPTPAEPPTPSARRRRSGDAPTRGQSGYLPPTLER